MLATVTHQQPLAFPNNDRPGIMLVSAGLTDLRDFDILVGQRIAMVGEDEGRTELRTAGAEAAILDSIKSAHGRRR